MTRAAALLAALLVAIGAPLDARAGACAQGGLVAMSLSHPADAVPDGAGVLVAATDAGYGAGLDGGDPLVGAWTFDPEQDDDGANVAVTLVTLAPGLARVAPHHTVRGKTGALLDGDGAKLTTVTFDAPIDGSGPGPWTNNAPAVSAVKTKKRMVRQGGSYRGKSPSYTTTVTLSKKPPAGARALILSRVDGKTLTPIAWVAVSPESGRKIEIYSSPGRCETRVPGLEVAEVGDRVQLIWVDSFGRPSPATKTIKVKRG